MFPVVEYDSLVEEALNYGLNRIREIFDFPLYEIKSIKIGDKYETKSLPNVKVADLMLKTVKMLDDRSKGAVTQRIEQKVTQENRNLHVHANANTPTNVDNLAHPDLVEAEIRKLENKLVNKDEQVIEAEIVDGSTTKASPVKS